MKKENKRSISLTAEEIEKRKKMHQRQNNILDDDQESNAGFDEDGNPITIEAAQKLYHADDNPLYITETKYMSPQQANDELIQGKKRIQELLKQAKFQQMNHFGKQMSDPINFDHKIANMPQIRVVKKPQRDKNSFLSQPTRVKDLQTMNINKKNTGVMDSSNSRNSRQFSTQQITGGMNKQSSFQNNTAGMIMKRQLNYDLISARIQKQLNGELNVSKKKTVFEPASPSFKYDKSKLELRKVYKNICLENRHSLQYDDAVVMSKTTESFFNYKRASKNGTAGSKQFRSNNTSRIVPGQSSYNNDMMYSQFQYKPGGNYHLRNITTAGYGFDQNSIEFYDAKINESILSAGFNNTSHMHAPMSVISGGGANSGGAGYGFFGGNRFHSKQANWDPHNSLHRDNSALCSPSLKMDTAEVILEDQFHTAMSQIRCPSRTKRQQMNIKIVQSNELNDLDKPEQFKATPSDDIPRNKLTECLARGLQAYVQRMQKRESFYAEIQVISCKGWTPAPRENSTICAVNNNCYLIGGLNHECNCEGARLTTSQYRPQWQNIEFNSIEGVQGRNRHTCITYGHKIIIFGGCYMYNMQRESRESTNQILVYDTLQNTYNPVSAKGINVVPRRDHCAALIGLSMIVYGGCLQNNSITSDMLTLDIQYFEWSRVNLKGSLKIEPFTQAQCVSVTVEHKKSYRTLGQPEELKRQSDQILEGLYFFGGKNAKGELQNKMYYLKCKMVDERISSAEWFKIPKIQGEAPCGRTGHGMLYLPSCSGIVIVGGRNDTECKSLNIPFLDDMHMFMLDQKAWVKIKYIPKSLNLCRISQHTLCALTSSDRDQKFVIFGGINNHTDQKKANLSNAAFMVEIVNIN